MKRILFCLTAAVLLLCLSPPTEAQMTYGLTHYEANIAYITSPNFNNPLWNFIGEVETTIEAFSLDSDVTITLPASGYILFPEMSAPGNPASNVGALYVADNGGTTTLYFKDSAGTATSCIAGAGTPAGSDTQMQYNNSGAFGAITGIIWDDTNLEFADDQSAAFGTSADWTVNFDDSADDQLLWLSAATAATATTDPLFEILVGASPTADQQVFGVGKGTQASNTALFTVDEDGDGVFAGTLTVSGTFYQTAIASAASGNVNLTIDAAGTGTITLGGTSTGKITTDNEMELTGDMDFSGTVISGVTLDDGVTDSPALTLQDATNETVAIVKKDNGDTEVTIPSDTDFEIVTGNLAVGNGSPGTAAMDGEDFYVNGDSEFDGAVQFDGLPTFAAGVNIDEDVDIDFDAADEEVSIVNSAQYGADGAQVLINNTDGDVTAAMYLVRLRYTDDGQANADYLVAEDNAGDDKFALSQGGTATWTLDAGSLVNIDADTTANTGTAGVLDIDVQSATNTHKAASITYQLEDGATQAYGWYVDVDDDTTGAEVIDAYHALNSAGTNATTRGFVVANTIDDAFVATLGAGAQALVIDAAATINTGTAGVIDSTTILSESAAVFLDLDVESEADGAGEIIYGIHVETDDDADNADNEIHAFHAATDGVNGTGLQHGFVQSGANADAGLYLQTGYLRVGTGSTADETLNADDGYFEGTVEVDGVVYADGGVQIDNTTLLTATVELSNADIKGLQGAAKELVAAPGAGSLLEFVSAMLILDYGSEVLTESADNLAIEYDNGSAAAASQTIEATNFVDQGADTISNAFPKNDVIDAAADIVNKNLALINNGDGEYGGNASNDTTMTVIITYRLHDTLGL